MLFIRKIFKMFPLRYYPKNDCHKTELDKMSYRHKKASFLLFGLISTFVIIELTATLGQVNGVVVDGTRKGPSALKNQSHEDEMIDGYNTKTCGISDPDNQRSEFVNSAKEGQFPWLVSFQVVKKDKGRAHFCMGSFISDKWILSAAHCWADP